MERKNQLAIHRLTGLWAFSEAGLGGFLHAFKSPFTGLILGSISICLVSLICHYAKYKWADLIKALSIVLLIKMMVSPHAMITAYIAVAFQGILGAILYQFLGINWLSIGLLSVIGLVESALQKVVTLTIIFGKSIWDAVDALGNWIASNFSMLLPIESSYLLIGTYVSLYFIFGLLLAIFIRRLLANVKTSEQNERYKIELANLKVESPNPKRKKKKRMIKFMISVIGVSLLIGLNLSGLNQSPWNKAFYVMLRATVILFIWFALLAPLLMKGLQSLLSKKNSTLGNEVSQTLALFPYLKQIASLSWKQAAKEKRIKRFQSFLFNSLMYTLHFKEREI